MYAMTPTGVVYPRHAGDVIATVRLAGEAGLPVLLVEVDRGTETAARVAEKFERYRRFFQVAVRDPAGGKSRPL